MSNILVHFWQSVKSLSTVENLENSGIIFVIFDNFCHFPVYKMAKSVWNFSKMYWNFWKLAVFVKYSGLFFRFSKIDRFCWKWTVIFKIFAFLLKMDGYFQDFWQKSKIPINFVKKFTRKVGIIFGRFSTVEIFWLSTRRRIVESRKFPANAWP